METSICPDAWGPSAWYFLHTLTLAFPDRPTMKQQHSARHLFHALSELLPCPRCQEHWARLLDKYPVDTHSRDKLSRWLVHLHNEVNTSLGKPTVPYAHAVEHHQNVNLTSMDTNTRPHTSVMLHMIVTGMLVLACVYATAKAS